MSQRPRPVRRAAARATVVAAPVPFPIRTADEVVDAVVGAVTPRTRLALIDHVTSPTGLVSPTRADRARARVRGIPLLADGAHAPGMVDLDLAALADAGVTWYAANSHKWVCSPKVGGFLWVRPDRQDGDPTRRHESRREQPASRPQPVPARVRLAGNAGPDGLALHPRRDPGRSEGSCPGGWPEIRARNRTLALAARDVLAGALGIETPAPDVDDRRPRAVPLGAAGDEGPESPDALHAALFDRFAIEVPVFSWPDPA